MLILITSALQIRMDRGVLKPIVEQKSCDEKRTPPSSKTSFFEATSSSRGGM